MEQSDNIVSGKGTSAKIFPFFLSEHNVIIMNNTEYDRSMDESSVSSMMVGTTLSYKVYIRRPKHKNMEAEIS